jgi:hypothetical protein
MAEAQDGSSTKHGTNIIGHRNSTKGKKVVSRERGRERSRDGGRERRRKTEGERATELL